MEFLQANLAFESSTLKSALDDKADGYIEGWATTPKLDSWQDIIEPMAFADSIRIRGLSSAQGIKLLLNHNVETIAGSIQNLRYKNGKLWIEAQMALDIGYVADAHKAMRAAGGLSFSVGFSSENFYIDKDGVRHITRGDLREVSIVPFPANEEAVITRFKSAFGGNANDCPQTVAEFEKFLIAKGFVKSRNEANEITRAVKLCPAFKAEGLSAPLGSQHNRQSPMLAKALADFAAVIR